MAPAVITFMTVVHAMYVQGALVLFQYHLDPSYMFQEFAGRLAIGTFLGLFIAQYLYLATPQRHSQILNEFASSPSRGLWWRNLLVLAWFIGGATLTSIALWYRDQV